MTTIELTSQVIGPPEGRGEILEEVPGSIPERASQNTRRIPGPWATRNSVGLRVVRAPAAAKVSSSFRWMPIRIKIRSVVLCG